MMGRFRDKFWFLGQPKCLKLKNEFLDNLFQSISQYPFNSSIDLRHPDMKIRVPPEIEVINKFLNLIELLLEGVI